MKRINQITEKQARTIAIMLNVPFDHFHAWEDKIMIGFKSDGRTERSLYIQQTGHISFFYNNGEPGGSGYKDINQLPIYDYLRLQGFGFEY